MNKMIDCIFSHRWHLLFNDRRAEGSTRRGRV